MLFRVKTTDVIKMWDINYSHIVPGHEPKVRIHRSIHRTHVFRTDSKEELKVKLEELKKTSLSSFNFIKNLRLNNAFKIDITSDVPILEEISEYEVVPLYKVERIDHDIRN